MSLPLHPSLAHSAGVPVTSRRAFRFAEIIALLTALSAAAALVVALVTAPARSGPFCIPETVERCIGYPYTDAAAYVPNDYLWMVPASLMALLFVVLVICVRQSATAGNAVFGQIAVVLAAIAGAVLFADYFIQLTVMQPSLLKGEVEGLSLFSQYNPHGVFIALEDVGCLLMGAAFLFVALVFDGPGRLERGLRWLFAASGVSVLAALVLLAIAFGSELEYRFEVAAIMIDWLALIVGGGLLSVYFRRAGR